ncbi:hypothetical protein JYU34_005793 [Plutella xylostella]|uniref:U6 small nuclear RNA (adenine-(43)-N(6))-methyltransferase n=1 Tax=Plutella xylostella TaxID=51655 RepID=A0ABQ7QU59_PLUXY|nr:hypothetical protein JYU34_005793 [Plutella xylostella]
MALNKFMHPRNIYKNPPDFANLAKTYPEFSEVAKVDLTGKVSIDFKDPKSLRVLTKYLLKSDFNLDVEIPEDRLVPTLPLRLNYILWVEDILASINKKENITGVDIGTGACAVYPLLAAAEKKWHMAATESDADSLAMAQANIERNNLQSFITVHHNVTSTVIDNLLSKDDKTYDFCMCNPPFYSNVQELCESRSTARPQPKNAFTGSPQELITEGGELEFIRNLITESKSYKNKVCVYTTMVGHKYNLKELLQDFKADGISHTHTEFCQGRVTRWGLAWTYEDHDLYKLVPPREKSRKKNTPVLIKLDKIKDTPYNIEGVTKKFKSILESLQITFKVVDKRGNNLTLLITAISNTWSNQRRKRRLMKRGESEPVKKVKPNEESVSESISDTPTADTSSDSAIMDRTMDSSTHSASPVENKIELNDVDREKEDPIIHACLKVLKKDNNFFFEMDFISGSGGKEGLHQIGQYIKNNWK